MNSLFQDEIVISRLWAFSSHYHDKHCKYALPHPGGELMLYGTALHYAI